MSERKAIIKDLIHTATGKVGSAVEAAQEKTKTGYAFIKDNMPLPSLKSFGNLIGMKPQSNAQEDRTQVIKNTMKNKK